MIDLSTHYLLYIIFLLLLIAIAYKLIEITVRAHMVGNLFKKWMLIYTFSLINLIGIIMIIKFIINV
jgi:hypothetical protein